MKLIKQFRPVNTHKHRANDFCSLTVSCHHDVIYEFKLILTQRFSADTSEIFEKALANAEKQVALYLKEIQQAITAVYEELKLDLINSIR